MIWVCLSLSGIGNTVLSSSKEILDREFFVQHVLGDFDEELAQNHPSKRYRDIFSILTVPFHIVHRGISIASESQDFLICHTARISPHATSAYSGH
jgi:hypothetical protein